MSNRTQPMSSFCKAELLQTVLSDHRAIKLEIIKKNKDKMLSHLGIRKFWVKKEVQTKMTEFLENNENTIHENLWNKFKEI